MSEFDRFVRHKLKPQAYVRYGDDLLLFYPTRRQVRQAKQQATKFLSDQLGLSVNPKNDVVVQPRAGLHFLGHIISQVSAVVDKHTTSSVLDKVDWHNVASYKALYLSKEVRQQVDWILLDKTIDLNDTIC